MDRFSVCVGSWKDCNLRKIESSLPNITRKHKTCTLALLFLSAASKSNQLLLWFLIPDSSSPKCEIFLVGEYDWCWVGEPLCLRILSSLWMCVFAALLVKVTVSQKHVEEALSAMVCVYIWYIFNLLSPAPISNCIFSSTFCHVYKMLVGRI